MSSQDVTTYLNHFSHSRTLDLGELLRLPEIRLPDSTINPAKWAYERIVKSIIAFEKRLDSEHEIGARLVSFGTTEVFHIEDMGYWEPHMIKFFGHNAERMPVELIQHVTQLSVLLVAMKKQHEQPRRIGFELSEKAKRN